MIIFVTYFAIDIIKIEEISAFFYLHMCLLFSQICRIFFFFGTFREVVGTLRMTCFSLFYCYASEVRLSCKQMKNFELLVSYTYEVLFL